MQGLWILILFGILIAFFTFILIKARKKNSKKLWFFLFTSHSICWMTSMFMAYYFNDNPENKMFGNLSTLPEWFFSIISSIALGIFFIIYIKIFKDSLIAEEELKSLNLELVKKETKNK